MTVKELIQKLSELNPSAQVMLSTGENYQVSSHIGPIIAAWKVDSGIVGLGCVEANELFEDSGDKEAEERLEAIKTAFMELEDSFHRLQREVDA